MEGRRDPDPALPADRPAAPSGAPPEAELGGPGPARGTVRRDTESASPGAAAAGHPGHDPALAPRHRRAPLGGAVHARQVRPPGDPQEHQGPGPTAGAGEPRMGVPQDPRRTGRPGVKVAASTVWEILKTNGTGPAPRRTGPTWSQFLRSQAGAILACDFFTIDLLDGTQAYVLAVIEHATRRIRILGVTPHPTGERTAQQARNLLMDLGGQADRMKFMIRDCGSNFTAAFDAALADADIRTVLCNVATPRMNAIAERSIGGMPTRAPRPHPDLEPEPSATDLARLRDPPQPASPSPLPARRRAAETATRTGRSRAVPPPKTHSRRWPDQRISPGRMTWTRFRHPQRPS